VINNDTTFLQLMHLVLADAGYDAHVFKQGSADYTQVRDLAPAAIILDLRLEHAAAGWDLLELFRLDPATAQTPIIVCSADVRALQEPAPSLQRQRCYVLPKPFDMEALTGLLRQALGPTTGATPEAL